MIAFEFMHRLIDSFWQQLLFSLVPLMDQQDLCFGVQFFLPSSQEPAPAVRAPAQDSNAASPNLSDPSPIQYPYRSHNL